MTWSTITSDQTINLTIPLTLNCLSLARWGINGRYYLWFVPTAVAFDQVKAICINGTEYSLITTTLNTINVTASTSMPFKNICQFKNIKI